PRLLPAGVALACGQPARRRQGPARRSARGLRRGPRARLRASGLKYSPRMELAGRHVVITGGAGGIGRALARRVAAEGLRGLVVADREHGPAHAVAEEVGGLALQFDAGLESSVSSLISHASDVYGPVDVFISNAGVPGAMGGPEAPDESW